MSVQRPRGINGDPNSRFMKAIRFALVTLLLGLQPANTIANEPVQEQEEKDYFDGIKIVPDDQPAKEDPSEQDKDSMDDPACTFDTCKYA